MSAAEPVLKPDHAAKRPHFIFTEEHERLRESIHAFVVKELAPHAEDWELNTFDDWVFPRMGELGFLGLSMPEEYGGQGGDYPCNLVLAEELVHAKCGGLAMGLAVHTDMATPPILAFGTDEQKQRLLKPLWTGEEVWCQLFSEPGAGSDLGGLTTRAERDGDRFIVNGQKVWCSGGRYSNWGILMARTNPDAPKHEGISFFAFPMNLPGVEIRPLRQMTGEAEFDEVFFADVELPADHLLGPLHGGWNVGMAVLTSERGHGSASVVGLKRRLSSMAQIGGDRRLGPVERQRLAALVAQGNAYISMAQQQGPIASTAASLLKLGLSEMMFEAAMLRGDLAGMDGSLLGPDASGMLAAPAGRIAGGTSQVQRNIIGERLLGLPREPRPAG
jgi:alkylation response protein AidB-like acyl-CoA dehydrogenase